MLSEARASSKMLLRLFTIKPSKALPDEPELDFTKKTLGSAGSGATSTPSKFQRKFKSFNEEAFMKNGTASTSRLEPGVITLAVMASEETRPKSGFFS